MKQVALGSLGLKVSRMGLGCMGMSEFYGTTDDAESVATIHLSLDRGMNFLDTADMYGPFKNEVLVGKAIKDRRGKVIEGNCRPAEFGTDLTVLRLILYQCGWTEPGAIDHDNFARR